jgi:benzoate-CoA ligase
MADGRVNLAEYFLDSNLPERASKVALRFEDVCYTFQEMHDWSCQVGNHLRNLGVREEDRVLLAMNDVPAFAATWFGVVRIGAVITMMNPIVPPEDWAYYLRYTRARVIVTETAFAEQHAGLLANAMKNQLVAVIRVDRPSDRDAILAESADCPYGDTAADDPSVWLFSSGSTGKPKGCVHVNADFVFNTEMYAKRVLGIRESDVTLSVPKQFFGYATGTNLMFPWAVGATTCFYRERATPELILAKIAEFRPTILTNVPTMIARMLEHPDCATTDLSSLRMVLSAGEALPAELYARWTSRTGVEILDGIGSAEMFHIYITNYPGDVKLGTLGRLVPGYEAKLVDPDGREVAPGEIGMLLIKGGSNAIWYHRDRAKSRATYLGDWTATGDQFRVDEEGRFVYCGRADDLLKVGGIYVSPVEVENCLLTHGRVRECAVVGVERDGLVVTCAFVVADAGSTEGLDAELQEYVKRTLAPHKYPRLVRFLADMPRNDRGKAARAELRKML